MNLLTLSEVAETLHVSERTVKRLIQVASLESVKVGRRRFVRNDQLARYLEQQRRQDRRRY